MLKKADHIFLEACSKNLWLSVVDCGGGEGPTSPKSTSSAKEQQRTPNFLSTSNTPNLVGKKLHFKLLKNVPKFIFVTAPLS